MLDIRWKAALYICALGIISLFLWLITSATTALIVFAIGLIFYFIRHLFWLNQLHNWLKKPELKTIPEGSGMWEDVFTALLPVSYTHLLRQTKSFPANV